MISTLFTLTARHRRLILVAAVLACVAVLVVAELAKSVFIVEKVVILALVLPVIGCGVLALVATLRPRPAVLVVDSAIPAFRTTPQAIKIILAVQFIALSAGQAGTRISAAGDDDPGFGWRLLDDVTMVVAIAVLVMTIWYVVAVWRGHLGVQLRPAGLVERGLLGSRTIPWDALAPGGPAPSSAASMFVPLTCTQPNLVQRRGLFFSRWRVPSDDVNAVFLADAIQHYLADPSARSTIGTQAGCMTSWWTPSTPSKCSSKLRRADGVRPSGEAVSGWRRLPDPNASPVCHVGVDGCARCGGRRCLDY